ncbi:MAG: hypothetical protein COZ77_04675 [Gallionellales bacterium CG_4_8_14_3_um_filter_54_18]|nr:MAG: hypothetical protein COZ77_04675 [Gallionellales bacterium CG_4_8_14_3_um_filter_54_18]
MQLVKKKIDLRSPDYSPNVNPLLSSNEVSIKSKRVRTGATSELIDSATGEVHTAVIHQTKRVDPEHFVKVFADGIKAAYDLNLTGSRVFQAILDVYQNSPMSGGYVDSVYLMFMDGGLCGATVGISESQFYRGLKILIEKGFLAPRTANLYWVNPHLFFRGDRAVFIHEYTRNNAKKDTENTAARDPRTVDYIEGKPDSD